MEDLREKVIRIKPQNGHTELYYVESIVPAPMLNVIDMRGETFTLPLADYSLAGARHVEKYWISRADAELQKSSISKN